MYFYYISVNQLKAPQKYENIIILETYLKQILECNCII